MSDIVKLSEEDLAWLAPDQAIDLVARRWLSAGPMSAGRTRSAGLATWAAMLAVMAQPKLGCTSFLAYWAILVHCSPHLSWFC